MADLRELNDIVEQQKMQIANLVRRHSELRDEHVALCSCLVASGALVTSQRVQALAHKHRFDECMQKHPCNLEGSLETVVQTHEIAVSVANYGGPLVMALFGCSSRSARMSVNEASSTYSLNFPTVCVLGGSRTHGEQLGTVDMYHPGAGGWKVPETMPRPRSETAAVVAGDRIIVIGGGTNTVDVFHPWAKTWSSLPNMNYDRAYAALVAVGESIWALGGSTRNGTTAIESRWEFEKLDLGTGKWEIMPNMRTRRAGLAAAVIGGVIHAVGGQLHQGDDNAAYLASMECFDPKVGEWQQLASMRSPRACAAAVELHRKLYMIGGYDVRTGRHDHHRDQFRELRTVERYDPELNIWESLGHMHVARFAAAATAVNGVICVFGGCHHADGDYRALVTAEQYDPQKNQWRRLPKMQLGVGRWGSAAIALGC